MAHVRAEGVVETTPAAQVGKDASTKPNGWRSLLLALSRAWSAPEHYPPFQVEPIPLQRKQDVRPAAGIEPEQDEAREVWYSPGLAQ